MVALSPTRDENSGMLPSGIPYPVTEGAVRAIKRGMKRKGIGPAKLGRMVGKTRQAVGQALRKVGTGACEFLPDMLRAVGESELLALPGLTDGELMLVEFVEDLVRQLPDGDAASAIERARRILTEKK